MNEGTDYVFKPDSSYLAYLESGAAALAAGPTGAPECDLPPGVADAVGTPEVTAPVAVRMERQDWHTGVDGVDIPFHWGLCGCLLERGQFAAEIKVLRRATRTASQDWSAEQYGAAREAFRRRQFGEALRTAEEALNGGGGHDGDRKNACAHFLVGLLRLGHFGHRDPAMLDLDAAEHAFDQCGRLMVATHPADAAWAFLAAAWADYCRGSFDGALLHLRLAVSLRSRFGEALYLRARLLARDNQPGTAGAVLAAAVAVHPSFARRALRDLEFAPAASVVAEVVAAERMRAEERAKAALEPMIKRGIELGLLDAAGERPVSLPPGSGALVAASSLVLARHLLGKQTLFGFAEAQVRAEETAGMLNQVVALSKSDRRALELALRQARDAIGHFTQMEGGTRPLSAAAMKEIREAETRLAAAEPALKAIHLPDFLKELEPARVAVAEAMQVLERAKRAAVEEAAHIKAQIEAEINAAPPPEEAWARYIRKGAGIGSLFSLIPMVYCWLFSTDSVFTSGNVEAVVRMALVAVGAAAIGAVAGAVFGPMANASAIAHRERLEQTRSELEQVLGQLEAVPVGMPGWRG